MKRWKETGCDGILIGRGSMQNPWIFRQFDDALHGREIFQPDLAEKKAVLLEFFEMVREEMPEMPALGKMKQLAGQFTKGLIGGAQFRQTLYHSHSAQEILDNITIYFQTLTERKTFGDGDIEADKDLIIDSCEAFSAEHDNYSNKINSAGTASFS
jgi:tRNA-dihydrouridine synthase B